MTVNISKSSIIKLKILAFYQIAGGLMGFYDLIIRSTTTFNIPGMLSFFAIGVLYTFSVYCGILLLNNHHERGLKLSANNQLLQILSFTIGGLNFKYTAGIIVLLNASFYKTFNSSGYSYGINFSPLPTSTLAIIQDKNMFSLAINLVAVYGVYFVRKLRSTINKEINEEGKEPQTILPPPDQIN